MAQNPLLIGCQWYVEGDALRYKWVSGLPTIVDESLQPIKDLLDKHPNLCTLKLNSRLLASFGPLLAEGGLLHDRITHLGLRIGAAPSDLVIKFLATTSFPFLKISLFPTRFTSPIGTLVGFIPR